jgi:anti-anti-sigma factor
MTGPMLSTDPSTEAGPYRPMFEIRQHHDADGALRVTLVGELDLAVTDRLRARLGQLQRCEPRIRLDLSELDFIDCRGVGSILTAIAEADRRRCELEVDRDVSPGVGRVTSLDEVAAALWPGDVRHAATC